MTSRFWDQIEIGDNINTVTKPPITRLEIAQFAAATGDFCPLNLDEEYAKSAGFGSVFAPGIMALGFAEQAVKFFAPNGKIISLSGTFQRIIWPGDSIIAKGIIIRRYQKNQEYRTQLALWCENQNQEIIMKGSAICMLFKNRAHQEQSQQLTPQISESTHNALIKKCQLTKRGPSRQSTEVSPLNKIPA